MPSLTDDQLEALLRRTFAAHETLADAGRALALTELAGRPPHSPHRPRWPVALVAAGVLLVAVLAAGWWAPGTPRSAPLAPLGTATAADQAAERAAREELARLNTLAQAARERGASSAARARAQARTSRARAELLRLIQLAHRPAGAIPAERGRAGDDLASAYGDQEYAELWVTVPGTWAVVVADVRAHPPGGLSRVAEDTRPGERDLGRTLSLTYGGEPTADYTSPLLRISVVAPPAGPVLVRYEAATSVRPARPAWFPGSTAITAVDFRIVRPDPGNPTTSMVIEQGRTLDAGDLAALGDALGSLDTIPQYAGHCPYRPGSSDEFTAHTAAGPVRVVADLDCPAVVRVTRPGGGEVVDLADPGALDRAWQQARRR